MRLMSFAATTQQMRAQTKTVTRRLDSKGYWMRVLKPGTLICAVEKGQGIPRGEQIQRIGVIQVIYIARTNLGAFTCYRPGSVEYASMQDECAMEGFADLTPEEFAVLFCRINKCKPDVDVTRIEFKHRPDLTTCCGAKRKVITNAYTDDIRIECSKCGGAQ